MKRISAATAVLMLLPLLIKAHEGHGQFHADDIRHYWGSPEHLVPIIILALVLAAILVQIAQLVIKRRNYHQK